MLTAEEYGTLAAELRTKNPADGLDALINPDPLSLGRIAILERANAAVLHGDVTSLTETLAALWLVRAPIDEAAAFWDERYARSAVWAEKLSPAAYRKELHALLGALSAFSRLLPRATEDQKKTDALETAG